MQRTASGLPMRAGGCISVPDMVKPTRVPSLVLKSKGACPRAVSGVVFRGQLRGLNGGGTIIGTARLAGVLVCECCDEDGLWGGVSVVRGVFQGVIRARCLTS